MAEKNRVRKGIKTRRVAVKRLPPRKIKGRDCDYNPNNYSGVQNEEARELDFIPEIALWRMVIWQAVLDYTYKPRKRADRKREDDMNKRHAKHWLYSRNRDFLIVCELAMLEPEIVVRSLARFREENYIPTPKRRKMHKKQTSLKSDLQQFLKVSRTPRRAPGNLICLPGVFTPSLLPIEQRL